MTFATPADTIRTDVPGDAGILFDAGNANALVALANGGALSVWFDSDTGSPVVRGQFLDAQNALQGNSFVIATPAISYAQNSIFELAAVALRDGRFAVTWTAPDAAGDDGVGVQVLNADGTALGSPFFANEVTGGAQRGADIVDLADGGFLVGWVDDSGVGGAIKARKFDANGVATGAEFLVNTTTGFTPDKLEIARGRDGDFLIGWESATDSNDIISFSGLSAPVDRLFWQAFDSLGTITGAEVATDVFTTRSARTVLLDDGNVAVVRNSERIPEQFLLSPDDVEDFIDYQILTDAGSVLRPATTIDFVTDFRSSMGKYAAVATADGGFTIASSGSVYFAGAFTNVTQITGDGIVRAQDSAYFGSQSDPFFGDIRGVFSKATELAIAADGDLLLSGGVAQYSTSTFELRTGRADDIANQDITGTGQSDALAATGVRGQVVRGLAGDDSLRDVASPDVRNALAGGEGNDIYVVSNARTRIYEWADEGADTVISERATFALPDNVETLELGSAATSGFGNAGDNFIIGNGGNNLLVGEAGDDVFVGGGGDDQIFGAGQYGFYPEFYEFNTARYLGIFDDYGLVLAAGAVTVEDLNASNGSEGFDTLTGIRFLEFADRTVDVLDVTTTVAQLDGTTGDDVLTVRSRTTAVDGKAGSDTVDFGNLLAPVSVSLATSGFQTISNSPGQGRVDMSFVAVENITATSFADYLGGNASDNVFLGLAGNDTLNAGDGDDSLNGGAGNDILNGGAGIDTATFGDAMRGVTVNLALTAAQGTYDGRDTLIDIENLVGSNFADGLRGNGVANVLNGGVGNDNLFGFGSSDTLIGGLGNDRLDGGDDADTLIGGRGRDVLTGGTGADTFVFDSFTGAPEPDTIKDFISGTDTIELSQSAFTAFAGDALGSLSASDFFIGTKALTADHHIIYNSATGALFYDADGVGGAAQVAIATLSAKPALAVSDILLVG